MKRKLTALIMATAMGLSCMVGLAGCGENEDNPPNTDGNEQTQEHTLVEHAAKAATCTETGNTAYWECTDCGKLFSDKDGENDSVRKLGGNIRCRKYFDNTEQNTAEHGAGY